jgi:hypothetical protein
MDKLVKIFANPDDLKSEKERPSEPDSLWFKNTWEISIFFISLAKITGATT